MALHSHTTFSIDKKSYPQFHKTYPVFTLSVDNYPKNPIYFYKFICYYIICSHFINFFILITL